MTPEEAAALLGVPPTATEADILRAYAARAAAVQPADRAAHEALALAREALIARARWLPPQGDPRPYPQPPYPQQSYPQRPYPQQRYPQPPYAAPYPQYGPAPRRTASTGAILGWTIGGLAALLVVAVVAVVLVFTGVRAAQRDLVVGPTAAPTAGATPSDPADYLVNGIHVHSAGGWTFVLTSSDECLATITVGFADSESGDALEEHTDSVQLGAGKPYSYTVPDNASTHDYAFIESIVCGTS